MDELVITWNGLLFEAVSFLIFTYLLNLCLFKPIKKILKERKDIENCGNENRKYFEDLTNKLYENAEHEKKKLKIEINKIKKDYGNEASNEAHRIVLYAKNEGILMSDNMIKKFGKEKNAIMEDYKSSVGEMANLIYKKILD